MIQNQYHAKLMSTCVQLPDYERISRTENNFWGFKLDFIEKWIISVTKINLNIHFIITLYFWKF